MSEEAARLLQQAIAAARAGDKVTARRLLIEVTELDERSEEAWLWLSGVVDDLEEMRICLENVLEINPNNERARQGVIWVERKLEEQAPPPREPVYPSTPPPPLPTGFPTPPPIEEQISTMPSLLASLAEEEEEEEPVVPENRVPCPACGALNFDFATECAKCRFPFAMMCPSCGELVPTETGFCPNCDAQLPLPMKLDTVVEREMQLDDAYRDGLAFMEQKRYQEAKVALEEVLAQNPGHLEALYNLGRACAELGLREEARGYWEEVRSRQPDYPSVEKDLLSLLSAKERRLLAREKKKQAEAERKKRTADTRPIGQSLIYEYEKQMEPALPVPEEDMGSLEAFLYVLLVGLVVGVAYALNLQPEIIPARLTADYILQIVKQAGVVAVILILFWIILTVSTRLLSLIFKGRGQMNGYAASTSRFLLPFFLLILPIVLGIPQIVNALPEVIRPWLRDPLQIPPVGDLPPLPWLVFGAICLFAGLFYYVRGASRVARISLWKGFLVGIVALAVACAAVYGLYVLVDSQGYLELMTERLGLGPQTPTPQGTPAPTPQGTPVPTPEGTVVPTPPVTPVPTPGGG